MADDEPRVVDDAEHARFEVLLGDTVAGYAEYHRNGPRLAITHTVIEPDFEGRGLGSALARGALDAARAAGQQVLPFCPFFRGYLERHPDDLDLVPASDRARFGLPEDGDRPAPS